MSVKYRNIKILGCSMNDSIKVLANSSLANEIISFRKLLVRYFNVREGNSSNLIIITKSKENAERLNKVISNNTFIEHLEKEFKVKINSFCNDKELNVEFKPNDYIFRTNNVKLTLNEFLYVSKNNDTLNDFLNKYNLNENSKIQLGSFSVQAITKFCNVLSRYKNMIFVEMKKPS